MFTFQPVPNKCRKHHQGSAEDPEDITGKSEGAALTFKHTLYQALSVCKTAVTCITENP